MTDAERVLEIAAGLMVSRSLNGTAESAAVRACRAFQDAEALLNEWRTRYPDSTHTAPREQPAQDVSDELLERLISASIAAVNTSRTQAEEIRLDRVVQEAKAIQRARAAQREGGMNSWPGGVRKAMTQDQHERWNALNYPGTRQLCSECESETGRCEEDAIYVGDRGPLCDECEGGRDV